MCGFALTSKIGKSLHSVGLLDGLDGIQYFDGLNSALEYCENELLKAFYRTKDVMDQQQTQPKLMGMYKKPDRLKFC